MEDSSGRTGGALRALALAALQQAWIAPAWADDAQRIQELEKQLARSLSLIEQLNQRMQQLETQRSVAAPAAPAITSAAPAEDASARVERLEQTVQTLSENSAKTHDLGVPLHGFADVGYVSGIPVPGRKAGFALGNFDLYMTPDLGPRIRSLVELVFEYGPEGGGVATDLERLQFGYVFSDAATLWIGRFHTPYGYWNTAFHHGQQIQTAASRPRFIDFEDRGGILPAHAVGLLASGGMRTGPGRLQYDAYVANGNQIRDRVLDMNTYGDDNGSKLLGGNVRYGFAGALEGLTVGVHGFGQKVAGYDAAGLVDGQTSVRMAGGFAVYDQNNWEAITEYYRFRNRDLLNDTGTHASWAGFGQVGYTIANLWTPYVRWEKASLDQGDAYFAGQESGRSYKAATLGVRYALNANAALKLELQRTDETQSDGTAHRTNGARFQFAVRF
jgi:hypothetical protein